MNMNNNKVKTINEVYNLVEAKYFGRGGPTIFMVTLIKTANYDK